MIERYISPNIKGPNIKGKVKKVIGGTAVGLFASASMANATELKKPSATNKAKIAPEHMVTSSAESKLRNMSPEQLVRRTVTTLASSALEQYRHPRKNQQAEIDLKALDEAGKRNELSIFKYILDGPGVGAYKISVVMPRNEKGKLVSSAAESYEILFNKYPNHIGKELPTEDTFGVTTYRFRADKEPDGKDADTSPEWNIQVGAVTLDGAGGQQSIFTGDGDGFFFNDQFMGINNEVKRVMGLAERGLPFKPINPDGTRI